MLRIREAKMREAPWMSEVASQVWEVEGLQEDQTEAGGEGFEEVQQRSEAEEGTTRLQPSRICNSSSGGSEETISLRTRLPEASSGEEEAALDEDSEVKEVSGEMLKSAEDRKQVGEEGVEERIFRSEEVEEEERVEAKKVKMQKRREEEVDGGVSEESTVEAVGNTEEVEEDTGETEEKTEVAVETTVAVEEITSAAKWNTETIGDSTGLEEVIGVIEESTVA